MAAADKDVRLDGTLGVATTQRLEIHEGVYDAALENISATGTVSVVTIPANFLVLSVVHRVLTVEGASSTFDIGDDASAALYGDDIVGSALTHGALITNRKFYSTANDIRLLINTTDADTLKVLIQVIGIDMTGLKDLANYAGIASTT